MNNALACDKEVDATGLLCPLPVLRARKVLASMAAGETLRLLATDPAAVVDVPHYCAGAGHLILAIEPGDDVTAYVIRKGAGVG